MRQFDVFTNPSRLTGDIAPFIVVLSSHFLHDLSVVIVAPLVRDRSKPTEELEIDIEFGGEALLMPLLDLYGLESQNLSRKRGSIALQEGSIRRGLNRLFTGF